MPDMPRTWKLILVIGAGIAVVTALLMRGDPADEPPPDRDPKPSAGIRIQPPTTWPDALTAGDRARLEPLLLDLEGTPDRIERALERLRDPALVAETGPRAGAVLLLLRPVLEEILLTTDDTLRRSAVSLVGVWLEAVPEAGRVKAGATIPVESLVHACAASDEVQLRREVVVLLGRIHGPAAIESLTRLAADADASVRREVLRALVAHPDTAPRAFFRQRFAAEADPGVRAEVLRLWRREPRFRTADLAVLVRPAADSSDTAVRVAAIELLGELGGRSTLETMGRALAHEDRDTRLAAILALGRIGGAGAGRLLSKLDDPGEDDPELSSRLAWARSRCGE